MTGPRLPHTKAAPTLTGGDDRPATPCEGRWYVYDILVDLTSGPAHRQALDEARGICSGCPIAAQCLAENRDEEWAKAIITGKTLMQRTAEKRTRKERVRKQQGKPSTLSRQAAQLAASNAERLANLEDMAEMGLPFNEITDRIGLNRDALRKWCKRNGHLPLFERIAGAPVQGRADRAPCGTPAGGKRHRNMGEKPCDACREAARSALREWRARSRDAA